MIDAPKIAPKKIIYSLDADVRREAFVDITINNEKKNRIIFLDGATIPIDSRAISSCFFQLYTAFNQQNTANVLQNLETLRYFAQSTIILEFNEFYSYKIPQMMETLLCITNLHEVHISFIRFLTELGKSTRQPILEPILKCSFFKNVLDVSYQNFHDDYFILDVLKCFYEISKSSEYARTQILTVTILEFLRKIILSPISTPNTAKKEQIEVKILAIKILDNVIKFGNLSSIQHNIILDFIQYFFRIRQTEFLWCRFLTTAKKMITDKDSCLLVASKMFDIVNNLISTNKNVAILANSILLIGRYYMYFDDIIPNLNYQKIFHYSKSSKDSVSYAAIWIMSNMIEGNTELLNLFVNEGLIPILVAKIEGESKMKTKFESVSAMSAIIRKGTNMQRMMCIQAGFVRCFIWMLNVDRNKFIMTAAKPLLLLMELGTTDTNFAVVWQMFDEEDGTNLLFEMSNSKEKNVAENVLAIYKLINQYRESFNHA